jgi:hypothetical protein
MYEGDIAKPQSGAFLQEGEVLFFIELTQQTGRIVE